MEVPWFALSRKQLLVVVLVRITSTHATTGSTGSCQDASTNGGQPFISKKIVFTKYTRYLDIHLPVSWYGRCGLNACYLFCDKIFSFLESRHIHNHL